MQIMFKCSKCGSELNVHFYPDCVDKSLAVKKYDARVQPCKKCTEENAKQ